MSTFRGARKFTSSRKQEIQLQRELEAIRSKALVDRYAREGGGPVAEEGIPSLVTHTPRPPNEPKPEMSFTIRRKTVGFQQMLPPASPKKTATDIHLQAKSQKPHKKPVKPAQEQKSPPQKVVVDSSTVPKKFAIISSLNTSVPVRYVEREPRRTAIVESVPQRSSLMAEDTKEARAVSQATSRVRSRASETSYQRQIVSQAEYLETDSNATTQSATPLVNQAEKANSSSKREKLEGDGSSSLLSGSTQASLRSFPSGCRSLDHAQHRLPEKSVSGEEPSICSLSDVSDQVTVKGSAESSQPSFHSRSENDSFQYPSAQVSHPQSGTLRLDINMRFDADEPVGQQLNAKTSRSPLFEMSGSALSAQSLSSARFAPESPAYSEKRVDIRGSLEEDTAHHSEESFGSEDEDQLESASQLLHQPQRHSLKFDSLGDSLSSVRAKSASQKSFDLPPPSIEAEAIHSRISLAQSEQGTPTPEQLLPTLLPSLVQPSTKSTVMKSSSEVSLSDEQEHSSSCKLPLNSNSSRLGKGTGCSSPTLAADSSNTAFSFPFTGSLSSLGAPFSLPSGSQTGNSTSDPYWSSNSYSTAVSSSKETTHKLEDQASEAGSGEIRLSPGIILPPAVKSSEQLAATTSYFFASMTSPVKETTVPPESSSTLSAAPSSRRVDGNLHFHPDQGLEEVQQREDLQAKSSQFGISMSAVTQASDVLPEEGSKQFVLQSASELKSASAFGNASEHYLGSNSALAVTGESPSLPSIKVEHAIKLSAPTDAESTMQLLLQGEKGEETEGVPVDQLASFLAFTEGPVTMEDIMSVQGRAVKAPPYREKGGTDLEKSLAVNSAATEAALDGSTQGAMQEVGAEVPSSKPRPGSSGGDQAVVFLSTWSQGVSHTSSTVHLTGRTGHGSIHHFCTKPLQPQLPVHLQVMSRKTHTQSYSYTNVNALAQPAPCRTHPPAIAPPPNTPGLQDSSLRRKRKHGRQPSEYAMADSKVVASCDLDAKLPTAEHRREPLLSTQPSQHGISPLEVSGVKMEVARDPGNLLWSLAPPKLSLHPTTVQSHLFPDHSSATEKTPEQKKSDIGDLERKKDGRQGRQVSRPRLLGVQSVPEFSKLKEYMHRNPQKTGDSVGSSSTPQPNELPLQAIHEEREPAISSQETTPGVNVPQQGGDVLMDSLSISPDSFQATSDPHSLQHEPSTGHPVAPQLSLQSRPAEMVTKPHTMEEQYEPALCEVQSLPTLSNWEQGGKVDASGKGSEYYTLMAELDQQKEQLVSFHRMQQAKKTLDEGEVVAYSSTLLDYSQSMDAGSSFLATSSSHTSRKFQRQALKVARQKGGATGRTRTLRRTRSALFRAQQARELLSQAPRQLQRSCSFPLFKGELAKLSKQEPSEDYHRTRRLSEPSSKDFLALMLSRGASADADPNEWAYKLWWDEWFPEVLQECRVAVTEVCSGRELIAILGDSAKSAKLQLVQKQHGKPRQVVERGDVAQGREQSNEATKSPEVTELENIDPLPTSDISEVKELEQETKELSQLINTCDETDPNVLAIHLCRRGAILRRIGRLSEAKEDLDKAILLAPTLSDAYWHRHLLFLVQSNKQSALEDLTCLLKNNKNHFGAYRSRANLLTKRGDISSAIFALSQAISLRPDDPESYFLRAELHEKRGEIESAIANYATVTKLDPGNLEAFKRQAMHKFNKGLWSQAVQHFTALIHRAPNDTSARIHRSRAFYSMGRFTEALQDLSAAIHLEPSQSEAYCHRACLLRDHHPQQALKDFSVSLLLDDSPDNVQAYVHRGVLYTQMKSFDEALADFESALRLDHNLPSAHICAGLIHLFQRQNLAKAIRCFSLALASDPTCIRAYLCRAEAYKHDENYQLAILDYTRAIHIQPDNPTYYIYKGEVYLKLHEFDLAAQHIRTAAKLNMGFEKSKRQGALVESFLGNHEEALSLLRGLPQTSDIGTLMAKVHMRAGEYTSATENFRKAIATTTTKPKQYAASSSNPQPSAVPNKAKSELHFLCGQSLSKSGNHREAVEEFSTVLQFNSDHEMAYYERGVSKLKLGNSKGVLDLNKALAINPQLFQAYLTRAAYYGKSGRFSKAILNCNEVIRLVPSSVRAYLYRGCLKYRMKSYAGAVEDFTMATELDPSHSHLALFNRALCYHAMGQLTKALSDYSATLLMQEVPDLKVLVNRGLLYLELRNHGNALLDFSETGKQVENDPAVYQAIGFCYHQLGLLQSAIEAYSEALDFDPSFLEAYVGRGNVCMDYLTQQGNERSKADYKQALKLSPGYLPAIVNLSLLLQAEGRYKQAWEALTEALGRDSGYAPALEARAIISLQMGNLFGALLDINAALKSSPTPELYTNRGVVHQFMGDVVSAMKDYHQATRMNPGYSLAHFNAGNILFQQRHFKEAISCYTQALPSSSSSTGWCGDKEDDSVLVNRAIAYVMLGEIQMALQDLDRAIEVNPYAAHTYFNRGNLHRSLGDHLAAEQNYRKALELQPDDWLTLYYHGEVLGTQGRTEEASECFGRAAQLEVPH